MKKLFKIGLIVAVIAIILFVLANANIGGPPGRPKNNEAAIKSNFSVIHTLVKEKTYANFCDNELIQQYISSVSTHSSKGSPVKCFSDESDWIITTGTKSKDPIYLCTDNTLSEKKFTQIDGSKYLSIENANTLCSDMPTTNQES